MKLKIAIPAVVACVYLALVTTVAVRHYGGNVSGFLCIGRGVATVPDKCPDVLGPDLFVRDDPGYDGQYYYYMALDPFIRTDVHNCTDGGAYRYQRVLLPFLASVLSAGRRQAIPYAILGINLCSIAAGTFLLVLFCRHFNLNPWLSLFYPFSNGILLSALRSTTEPLYLCFLIAGAYLYLVKEKHLAAALVFCLAVLSKEVALTAVAGFGVYQVLKEKRISRNALVLALPFAVYCAWQAYIYAHFGKFSFNVGMDGSFKSVDSVKGFFERTAIAFSSVNAPTFRQIYEPLLIGNVLLMLGLIVYNVPYKIFSVNNPFQISALLSAWGLLAVGFYPPRTLDIWGYGRHSSEIFLCGLFFYLFQRKNIFLVPVILNSVSFVIFLLQKAQ